MTFDPNTAAIMLAQPTGWLNPENPALSTPAATPDDVQRRLALAQALQQQGMSTKPIQSGWQGAAMLAQGLLGGLQERQARQDEAAGRASGMKAIADALNAYGGGSPAVTPQNAAPAAGLASTDGPTGTASGGSLPTFASGQGASPVMAPGALAGTFANAEKANGLPSGYLSRTAQIESSFNPNARNGKAAGLFQFMPDTARAYGLTDPMDPVASTDAAARLASSNAAVLRNGLGHEPTSGELYLAHQQGAAGALKLLQNPDAPAASLVGANAVIANGGSPNMTGAQFAGLWTGKFGGGSAGQRSAGVPLGPLATGQAPVQVASLNPNFAPGGGMTMPAGVPMPQAGGMTMPASAQPAPGSSGRPYGSQPVNIPGHGMLTRQQAEDTDGIDGTDYDDAVRKAGAAPAPDPSRFAGTVPIAPSSGPSAASSTVTGAQAAAPSPTAYAIDHGTNETQARQTGTPMVQPSAGSPSAPNTAALLAVINNPWSSPAAQQVAGQLLAAQMKPRDTFQTYTDKDGSVWQRDGLTGEAKLLQDNSKPDHYGVVKNEDGTSFAYDKSDPSKIIPFAPSGQAYRPATPDEKAQTGAAYIGPGGKPVFAPAAAANISVGGEEKASEKAFGDAQGKEFGEILKAGQSARSTMGQLALMKDAFDNGGGQISTGPFAKSILGAKQAILNTTGIDLGGISETEAVQKLGFGLATNLTKEITQRPAQQEFLKALENVPGIFMSPQGSKVMMSILDQQAQQKVDLARLVANPENRKKWSDVEQAYYDAHPLISPFSGKPLTAGDVSGLASAAQQAGFDPATGRSASIPAAPASNTLNQARTAIAKGAPRDAVIQRLRQNGVDPAGL